MAWKTLSPTPATCICRWSLLQAIYALMACVVAHAALADAGCVLEYHIVIFCIWLGLRRLG